MTKFQRGIVTRGLDKVDRLTSFERKFIRDLAQYEDTRRLTEDQNKIINQISQKLL